MAVIHISEVEAARDLAGVMARVYAGEEVIIEDGALAVAMVPTPVPPRRSIADCIALLPKDSAGVIDEDFAKDIEAAIEAHREPLNSPTWD
jgi:antitoxin (DNA-binding transcriptional repressor) of toxin-antitoxin stability system